MTLRILALAVISSFSVLGASAQGDGSQAAVECGIPTGPEHSLDSFFDPMGALGLDQKNSADKITYLKQLAERPETACGVAGVARYLAVVEHFNPPGVADPYPAIEAAFAHPLFKTKDAEILRSSLVELTVLHASLSATTERAAAVLTDQHEFLLKPQRDVRGIYSQFLAHAGMAEDANRMAEQILLDSVTGKARLTGSFPAGETLREISYAFRTFLITGAADLAIESLARLPVDHASIDEQSVVLYLVPKSTNPSGSLDKISLHLSDLSRLVDQGYVSPEDQMAVYGLLIAANQSAGRSQTAEDYLEIGKKRFGKSFDPAASAERRISQYRRPAGDADQLTRSEARLIEPPRPNWPWEVTEIIPAKCTARFNIDKSGKPINIQTECSDDRFLKSAENAIKRARFEPMTLQGQPQIRYNVIQEIEYQ